MAAKLLVWLAICRLIVAVGLNVDPTAELHRLGGQILVSDDRADLAAASSDFGLLTRLENPPAAVVRPSTAEDVAAVVRTAASVGVAVSARGHGHSINGQAHVSGGVVVKMSHGGRTWATPRVVSEEDRTRSSVLISLKPASYVDAWGGELWIDVLRRTLEVGMAPRSWTDYLYLTVGGTLSNAGISGQAFHHGPQISNVHELDVVTGKGEILTCSDQENSELFYAALGGLGQFGIITRARIAIEPAPQRVKWIRVLYSDFAAFTKDQEYLISLHERKFDYVEGFVIVDEGLINNWRSSFFSPRNPIKISSFGTKDGVLYCLEVTKNYDESTADTVDQEVEYLMRNLNFIPSTVFSTDMGYVEFLDRVHRAELNLRSKNLWDVPHPWLNLFVPKSRIADFDRGVFKGILGNKTSGPILIYPMNKDRWDPRSSAVTPDEDVFYLVALLRSALDNGDEIHSLSYLSDQNLQILRFCNDHDIKVKQYLPRYTTEAEWRNHFGNKWDRFNRNKMRFDPNRILATGQRIFRPSFESNNAYVAKQ